MKHIVTYINEARRPKKVEPNDKLRAWYKTHFNIVYKSNLSELADWNENVTFKDIYNKIRENGPKNPTDGLWEMIWKNDKAIRRFTEFDNLYRVVDGIFKELAKLYNIHNGEILKNPDAPEHEQRVDRDSFLKKWIHEN